MPKATTWTRPLPAAQAGAKIRASAVYIPQREQWTSSIRSPSTRQSQLSPSHDLPLTSATPHRSPMFDSSMQELPSEYFGHSSVRSRPSTKSNDDEGKQGKSPALATTSNPIRRPSNDTQRTPTTVGQQQYIPGVASPNSQGPLSAQHSSPTVPTHLCSPHSKAKTFTDHRMRLHGRMFASNA